MKRPAFLKRWQYARGYGASRRVALRNALGLQYRPRRIRAWVAYLKDRWRWIDPWRRWRCDHVHDLIIYRRSDVPMLSKWEKQHMICCYCGSRSWKKEKALNKAEDFIKTIDPRHLP